VERHEIQECVLRIGIRQQHQNGSVEECSDKDQNHNGSSLLRLRVEANPLNEYDSNVADDHIDHRDAHGDRFRQHVTTSHVRVILAAKSISCVKDGTSGVILAVALVKTDTLLL